MDGRYVLMCDDIEKARRNREIVKTDVGNAFYDKQWELLHHWQWGCRMPKGLILGELPSSTLPRTVKQYFDANFFISPEIKIQGGKAAEVTCANSKNGGAATMDSTEIAKEVATTNRQNLVDKRGNENRYPNIRNLCFKLRVAYLVSRLSSAHQEMIKAMAMELLKLERLERGELFLEGDCEDPLVLMLTDRETEVLNYIAEGYPDKRIALEMAWSVPTVKRCVGLIKRKLSAANRTQAVVRAFRQGLIEERNKERCTSNQR